jgi:hypothetical protein
LNFAILAAVLRSANCWVYKSKRRLKVDTPARPKSNSNIFLSPMISLTGGNRTFRSLSCCGVNPMGRRTGPLMNSREIRLPQFVVLAAVFRLNLIYWRV